MKRLIAACILMVWVGCGYDARLTDCSIRCTAAENGEDACPDGMTCGNENICRPPGATDTCGSDASVPACMNVADPVVDLALNRPVQADQVIDAGGAAKHANDGNDGTRWSTADGVPGHYWMVDLGADHLLTSVNTLWEYDGVNYKYDVAISSDGTNFTVAIDKTADTRTARARMDAFTTATCTRFVRIRKTDTTGYWAILYTVNVLGR